MILAVCPSRERTADARECAQSFLDTAKDPATSLCFYIDRDQERAYTDAFLDLAPVLHSVVNGQVHHRERTGRVILLVGNRIGPVSASNLVVHHYRDPFSIYGMLPDDSLFKTPGWDLYLKSKLDSPIPHMVSAAHTGGDHVNFPWVNRPWVEAVGWYYYPHSFHHCGDTILELLGECANAMTYTTRDEMFMHHQLRHTFNRDKYKDDCENFLMWTVSDRRATVASVREKIAAAKLA